MNTLFFPSFHQIARPASALALLVLLTSLTSGCTDSKATSASNPSLAAGTSNPSLAAGAADKAYYHQAQSDVLKQQSHYQVQRRFVGKVESNQNADIGFEQNGKIAALYVNEGDKVKQGSVLAQQDTALLETEKEELLARMVQVKADLILVDADLKRIRALKKNAFSAQQTLDELQARRQGFIASKKRIEAGLHSIAVKIEKSSLLAPFDGVISQRFIALGEVIAAGSPALKLVQTGSDEIKVGVPVSLLSQLDLTQALTVTIAGQTHGVKLLTRGQDVDQITRTVQLRFAFLNNAIDMVNGQLAYLNLPQQYQQDGFWVPTTALTDGVRGLWNVYTLTPGSKTNKANLFTLQARNVQIRYTTENAAYISGAIADGERYLTGGLQRLVPGQTVRTATSSSITPSALSFAAGSAPTAGRE
jgi:RND family efflux transporter MFP subunit